MKIKEMLEKLSVLDPELDIVIYCDDGYCYDLSDYFEKGYCHDGKFSKNVDSKNINAVEFTIIT